MDKLTLCKELCEHCRKIVERDRCDVETELAMNIVIQLFTNSENQFTKSNKVEEIIITCIEDAKINKHDISRMIQTYMELVDFYRFVKTGQSNLRHTYKRYHIESGEEVTYIQPLQKLHNLAKQNVLGLPLESA